MQGTLQYKPPVYSRDFSLYPELPSDFSLNAVCCVFPHKEASLPFRGGNEGEV